MLLLYNASLPGSAAALLVCCGGQVEALCRPRPLAPGVGGAARRLQSLHGGT